MKFRKALKQIFKTPSGETVLKFLKEAYVEVNAFDENTNVTYYRLGQKELIQGILADIESEENPNE